MQIAGCVVAAVLALMVGFSGGVSMGRDAERKFIANDCRQAGRSRISGLGLSAR